MRLAFGGGHTLVCDHYESGDAFLQAFPSKNYQVVFLDICMEGTNGIETARILRRTDPRPAAGVRDLVPGIRMGRIPRPPFDYLLKPYREEKALPAGRRAAAGALPGRTGAGSPHRTAAGTSPLAEDTVRHGPEPLRPHRQRRRRVPDRLHLLPGGAAAAGAGELHRLQPGRHPEHGQGAPAGQRLLRDAGRHLPAPCARRTRIPCSPSSHNISSAICGGSYDAERRPDLGLSLLFGRYFLTSPSSTQGHSLSRAPVGACEGTPGAPLCWQPLVTVICLAAAALCAIFELDSNILLLPTLLAAFWSLRWRVGPEVSREPDCLSLRRLLRHDGSLPLLSVVLNARAGGQRRPGLSLSPPPCSSWDSRQCSASSSGSPPSSGAAGCVGVPGEAFWQSAWPLPTIYAAFLVFCMPLGPGRRAHQPSDDHFLSWLSPSLCWASFAAVRDVSGSPGIYPQRPARPGKPASGRGIPPLHRAAEPIWSRRGISRHDFRQHLPVIAGLTEAGQDELKNYLHQYESELSEERPPSARILPWMLWPVTTTTRPTASACRWTGGWNCPLPAGHPGGRLLHDAGQSVGKCFPRQPEAAARTAAGEGNGPDAEPRHAGPAGGEPLVTACSSASRAPFTPRNTTEWASASSPSRRPFPIWRFYDRRDRERFVRV